MKEVVFVRIPKNASTSMYEAFKGINIIEKRKDVFFDDVFESQYCNSIFDPTHLTLEMAISYLGEKILDLPIICVCRNPLDRIVSAYEFAKKENLFALYGNPNMSFANFARIYCYTVDNKDFFHSNRQVDFIKYKGELCYTFAMHFEYLLDEVDFANFMFKLDLPELQHLNSTQHKPFMEYYDSELEKLVRETYKEDFKTFGY